ncbi:unnamed protein product [Rotaria sordida]|uniref:Uncharacterized protein n=2 Tax=Rotaria sordida TaxID=392033 RepID=A0A814S0E9_9BILA|nr:unnamed protein product [Rotaria sordida]CAF3721580.1 unnamed protein product [Rotaria sordida]
MSQHELHGDPKKAGPQPIPDYGLNSYKGTGKLQGKIAIITGGDSGIGRAVAWAFAREGATIVISYLNEHEDAKEIQQAIGKIGQECIVVPGDISQVNILFLSEIKNKEEQCKKMIDITVSIFQRIDILVNNAAYQGKQLSDITELTHDRVEYTFKTNIIAMFDLVKYAVPHIPKGGAIINVGSIQAYDPSAEILDYAVTKAAIVGFTKGLARKLLEKGIRVNCVAPGPVWTPLVVASFPKDKNAKFGEGYPIKRPAQPRELASAFVCLASATDSSYIFGEILAVTDGEPTV